MRRLLLELLPHVQEGRGARTSVQVLVGAAHGQLHPSALELDGHRARRMREVPEHRGRRGGAVDLLDVRKRAGAVGHLGEHHQGNVGAGARSLHVVGLRAVHGMGVEDAQLASVQTGQTVEHVAVGGEVLRVGDDRSGAGVKDRAGELEEVDRGGVRDDHLPRAGAQHAGGEEIADPFREVDPLVPAADELRPPPVGHLYEALARGQRETAERVAVEVNRLGVVEHEAVAERRERVLRVEALCIRPVGHRSASHVVTVRQATVSGSRCSSCPTPGSSTSSQGSPPSAARRA